MKFVYLLLVYMDPYWKVLTHDIYKYLQKLAGNPVHGDGSNNQHKLCSSNETDIA